MKSKNWQSYSVELAKAKINFYEPFQRLLLRRIVQDILINTSSLRLDLFAIFDAVNKRGGFTKVEELKRWIQIQYSLPYYKCNFREIYLEHILKRQNEVKKYLKLYNKQYKSIDESFVQLHFISTTSSGGYYHFQDDENSFCKQNFTHIDLYMNIKSICLIRASPKKIIAEFADKYLLTRKWFVMKGYSRPHSEEQLDQLQIIKIYNNNASIAIIGWNLPNVLLALKLYQLKFNVVLYTNFQKHHDQKSLQRVLSVQQGVFFLDDGVGGPFSYSQLLKQNKIQLAEASNYCGLIDQNGRTIPQFRVRQSQQIFLALLADYKFQEGNHRTMSQEIHSLLARKKITDQFNLVSWHLERYLMLNNLHGQDTTINLHYNYLNRRKHKIFMYKKKPIYIKTCLKLVQKAAKSFTLVHAKPKTIDFCNNMWVIQERINQRRSFSSLIYSDSEQIFEMVNTKSYKVPSMQHQNFTILKDLTSNLWINCCFKFKQKLKLKQDVSSELSRRKKDFMKICQYDMSEEQCCFQFKGKFGFYYYFIAQNGYGLMASCKVQRILSSSSTPSQLKQSLSSQILKQFQINILSFKLPQFSQPQICEYSYSFYMKQESLSRDRIVKLKNWQRMYLSIGFPWSLNSNKLSSQIDVTNQILALITNVYYHLYKYDEKAKQSFSQQYRLKKKEILKKQQDNTAFVAVQKMTLKQQHHQSFVSSTKIIPESLEYKLPQQKIISQTIKIHPLVIIPESCQNTDLQLKVSCILEPRLQEIFSPDKISLNQGISDDPFGFNSPFIRETFLYLSRQVQKFNIQISERIKAHNQKNLQHSFDFQPLQRRLKTFLKQFQNSFTLQHPYKVYRNTYLHSLGKLDLRMLQVKDFLTKVRQIEHRISNSAQSKQNQPSRALNYEIKINLFDGYMTKRQFYSLQNPYSTTIYIQCILYISRQKSEQPRPYYIIFQATNLAIFYYHKSLKRLVQIFNAHIQKQKLSHTKNSLQLRTNPNAVSENCKEIELLVEQIRRKIEQEIRFNCKEEYLSESQQHDKILLSKLKSEVPESFYDDRSEENIYTKISYPQKNEQKTQYLINNLNQLVKYELQLNGIKSDINFLDIFFGYLSNKYFVFQMISSHIQKNITDKNSRLRQSKQKDMFKQVLEDIRIQDQKLYLQIQDILNEDNPSGIQPFPLKIFFDQERLTVERKFLAGKNDSLLIRSQKNQQIQLQSDGPVKSSNNIKNRTNESYHIEKQQKLKKYIFMKQFNTPRQGQSNDRKSQKTRCYLTIGENQEKIDLDPRENPLELIVSILVDSWNEEQIYDNFKILLNNEIQSCEYGLSKQMKLYYQATRKQTSILRIEQINSLRKSLSFRKSKNNFPQKQVFKQNCPTEYCSDEDERQTIYQHIQDEKYGIR